MEQATIDLYNICIGDSPPDKLESILSSFPNIANQKKKENDYTFPLIIALQYKAPITVVQALIDAWPEGHQHHELHFLLGMSYTSTDEHALVEAVEAVITAWPEAVKTPDRNGSLPIHHAAQYESLEVIELLLKSWPAGIQARTEQCKELALHVACYCGRSVSILECLLHAWPDGAMVIDKYGHTPLHDLFNVSKRIPLASVKLILEAWPGAVKVQDGQNDLPLHRALYFRRINERYDIIKCLVDAWPAAIEVPNKHGRLPVDLLNSCQISSTSSTTTKLLHLLTGGTIPPLHFVCAHGSPLSTIQLIVKQLGTNAVSEPFDGMLVLHQACRQVKSTLETVQFLTDSHPQAVEAPMERTGQLALHLACQNGLKASIVHHLANLYPAAAALPDHKGYYALHYACIGNCCGDNVLHRLAQLYPCGVTTAVARRGGCLPFHLAVLNVETSLTVMYSLLRMHPEECLYPMGKTQEVCHVEAGGKKRRMDEMLL